MSSRAFPKTHDKPSNSAQRNPASHIDRYANFNLDCCSNRYADGFSGRAETKSSANL